MRNGKNNANHANEPQWQPTSDWRELLPLGLDFDGEAPGELTARERCPLDVALAEDAAAREEKAAFEEALEPLRALRTQQQVPSMPAHLAARVKAAVAADVAERVRKAAAAPAEPEGAKIVWLGAPRGGFAAAAVLLLAVGAGLWVAFTLGLGNMVEQRQKQLGTPSTIGSSVQPEIEPQQDNETLDVPAHVTRDDQASDAERVGVVLDAVDQISFSWPHAFEVSARGEMHPSRDGSIHAVRALDGTQRAGGVRYATSDAQSLGDTSGTTLPRGEVQRDPSKHTATF